MVGRWSSFAFSGEGEDGWRHSDTRRNPRASDGNARQRSAFLEEEEDSREIGSWENRDEDSLENSAISSLSGTVNRPVGQVDQLKQQEEKEAEDMEQGGEKPLVHPSTTPNRSQTFRDRVGSAGARVLSFTHLREAIKPKAQIQQTSQRAFNSASAKSATSRRRLCWFWSILGLVTFLAILIGSILIAKKNSSSGSDGNVDQGTPVEEDNDNLTPREKALLDIFSMVSSSGLNDDGSPQDQAKQWMFRSDPLTLSLSDSVSEDRIAQRYALAVFYFSTNGPKTWDANNWLQGDECSNLYWTGLSCTEDNKVRAIAFDNYGLEGTIPEELGVLTVLENLVLKNHPKLAGTIPMSIGNLQILGQLGLYNNALTGGIPVELYAATHLNYINLQNNMLEGGLILRIEKLRNLEKLILFNNKFSGGVPVRQLARTGIKFLGLSNNKFSGSLPEQISNLPLLEYLYLDGNAFTGTIPPNLGRLTNLVSLNFDRNSFAGSIPSEVGGMRDLEYASLQENILTGSIPIEIASLERLRILNLGANQLTGKLPDLSPLTNLSHLHLHFNMLTGTLPVSLGRLSKLEVLLLGSNKFDGSIDQILKGKLNLIEGLYLSDNQFSGTIPTALCGLTGLKALFLDANEFTGSIPDCVGSLADLRQVYLFSNKLSGALPDSLGGLRRLSGLGLENNDLGGKFPEEICSINSLQDIWADCGGSTPEIICNCCSICCPSAECQ